MATISSYPFTIQPENVDFTLRASVASIISYMLNVAGTDAHRKGFGVEALQGHSFTWVLSRLAVDINTQPRQYSNIEIDTWVNEFNRLSSTRNFKMRIGEDVIAAGVSQWCMLNMETRQVVDMSLLKDTYERAMVAESSPIAAPARLRPSEPTSTSERKVVYSDIDFNRHVNTMRYIRMMLNTLPIEYLTENRPMRLDIHFAKECRLGEVLTIGYEQRDNPSLFEIRNGEGAVACTAAIEWK